MKFIKFSIFLALAQATHQGIPHVQPSSPDSEIPGDSQYVVPGDTNYEQFGSEAV